MTGAVRARQWARRPPTAYPQIRMPRLLALLTTLALLASGCAQAIGNPRTAAEVNGEAIAIADIEDLVAEAATGVNPQTGQPQPEDAAAVTVLSDVVLLELLSQELAERGGDRVTAADLDDAVADAEEAAGGEQAFDDQLAQQGFSRERFRFEQRFQLTVTRLTDVLSADVEVTEEDVQAAYDAQFGLPTVSHILVATEEEAEAVIERIEGGEDFAAVASEVSTDQGSAAQGGQLGQLQPGAFVPEFEEAALAVEPGELSDPVETQFGFHVIRTEAPPELGDDLRDQIETQLAQQQVQPLLGELLQDVLDAGQVEINPRFGTWDPQFTPEGGLTQLIAAGDPLGDLQPVSAGVGDAIGGDAAVPGATPAPTPAQ